MNTIYILDLPSIYIAVLLAVRRVDTPDKKALGDRYLATDQ